MTYSALTNVNGRTIDGRGYRSMSFFVFNTGGKDGESGESLVKSHTLRVNPQVYSITDLTRDSIEFPQGSPIVNHFGSKQVAKVSIKGNTLRQATKTQAGITIDGASHIKDLRETLLFAGGAVRRVSPDGEIIATLYNQNGNPVDVPLRNIRVDFFNWGAPRAKEQFWFDYYTAIFVGEGVRIMQNRERPLLYEYSMDFFCIHRERAEAFNPISNEVAEQLRIDTITEGLLKSLREPVSLDYNPVGAL